MKGIIVTAESVRGTTILNGGSKPMFDIATIKEMRHAIGLDHQNPKRGKYEAYRNYAQYNAPHPIWDPLVLEGLAKCYKEEREGQTPHTAYWYSLTRAGLDLMEAIIGAKIEEIR